MMQKGWCDAHEKAWSAYLMASLLKHGRMPLRTTLCLGSDKVALVSMFGRPAGLAIYMHAFVT